MSSLRRSGFLRPSTPLLNVFLILATATAVSAATVGSGDSPGEKTYQEDFSDPSVVDNGAGTTPGFDPTGAPLQGGSGGQALRFHGDTGDQIASFPT